MVSEFDPGIQDCPHCLSRVFILGDGICPGCQGNAREMTATTNLALWIYETDKIPDLCHKCGCSAERRIRVSHTQATETPENAVDRDPDYVLRRILMWAFGGAIVVGLAAVVRQIFGRNSVRQFEAISIRIPECRKCKSGQVEPISANISERSLKIAVHSHFAEEHKRQNCHQSSGKSN